MKVCLSMNEKWFVIGEDARLKFVAKKLTDENRTVFYKKSSKWDDDIQQAYNAFMPTKMILPIQPLEVDGDIRIKPTTEVFIGKSNYTWQGALANTNVHHYLQHEPYIWKNAHLTALGLLAFLFQKEKLVENKTILITGFGRVAKMTAKLFATLGSNIIISVRSPIQLAEAQAYQYEAIPLSAIHERQADYLINTIPSRWLSNDYPTYLKSQIYDLASAPGCLTADADATRYELLPALPSKFFPEAAAELLYDAILQLDKGGQTCCKENG